MSRRALSLSLLACFLACLAAIAVIAWPLSSSAGVPNSPAVEGHGLPYAPPGIHVDNRVTMKGQIVRLAVDGRKGRSRVVYHLLSKGHGTALVGDGKALAASVGQESLVTGHRVSGALSVTSIVRLVGPTSSAGSSVAADSISGLMKTTGNISVALILINFSDDRRTPWTPAQAQSLSSSGLNSYYGEASGGLTSFTVTPFGWYQLTAPAAGCDYYTWQNEAFAQAAANGVNLAAYDHVMLVFPLEPPSVCNWGGLGEMPGQVTWINGYIDPSQISHEMGHNLGLAHANALVCPGVTLAASGCVDQEYGDPFDVMGYSWRSLYEFSSWHKAQLGWLDSSEQQTVSTSGDYALVADEAPRDSGVKLLLISLPGGGSYALETRQQIGQDDSVIDPRATTGVLIRIAPAMNQLTQPQLLDGTPSTATFDDAAFQSGQCFVDAANHLSVETLSAGAGHAVVHIDLDSGSCSGSGGTGGGGGSGSLNLKITGAAEGTDLVAVGQQFVFDLSVVASGSNASNVVVSGSFPGATLVSGTTASGACTSSGSGVSCPLGNLASGSQAAVKLVLQGTVAGTVAGTFAVRADQSDATPSDNSVILHQSIAGAAKIALKLLSQPLVSGAAHTGLLLLSTSGKWRGATATYVVWSRCDRRGGHCIRIWAAGHRLSYRLTRADAGHRLRTTVFATDGQGWQKAQSSATAIVKPAA